MPAQTSLLTGNINIIPTKKYEAQTKKKFKHFHVAGLGSQRRRGDWEPDFPVTASPILCFLPGQAKACQTTLDVRTAADTVEVVAPSHWQFLRGDPAKKTRQQQWQLALLNLRPLQG